MIYFTAAVLGIIQGLTEFLPISSTAHLLIGGRLLHFDDPGGVFTVMIQLGSILAIVWLYRATILEVVLGLLSSMSARRFTLMLIVAFVPAAFAGAVLGKFISQVLYEDSPLVIASTFIIGGLVILVVEQLSLKVAVDDARTTPIGRAFGIGLCQTLALIPGVSRSGATIVGGRILGLSRQAAAEFSFFLAMPTMAAAFAYKLLEVRHHLARGQATEIAIGFLMAFVASLLVVKPFLRFVGRSGFTPFAWYRIVAGLAILAAMGAGWL
ncbi:MAG TPA: undecaprenyl-diphosphate phosphatase [Vicinamibacterales bacterium]